MASDMDTLKLAISEIKGTLRDLEKRLELLERHIKKSATISSEAYEKAEEALVKVKGEEEEEEGMAKEYG